MKQLIKSVIVAIKFFWVITKLLWTAVTSEMPHRCGFCGRGGCWCKDEPRIG